MARPRILLTPRLPLTLGLCLALAGCGDFDLDFRGTGANTSGAALRAAAPRPEPDGRGIISYPSYQVAVANRGDTVATVAARVGTDANALARFNGIPTDVPLRQGEILALPTRVAEPTAPLTTDTVTTTPLNSAPGATPGAVDITSIASGAIDRAGATTPAPQATPVVQAGPEPIRHKVVRGETAYSIARIYGISPRVLSEWNGLGADLTVREGQYLLIPAAAAAPAPAPEPEVAATAPGEGSPTPTPPSASAPLPAQDETPEASVETPASPNLAEEQTETAEGRLVYPVTGRIIRDYAKGRNEGIDIAAAAGTPVKAADAGTVAAITRDTEQVPIIVVRHQGNLLTW